jgi:flagellar motor protein MotB
MRAILISLTAASLALLGACATQEQKPAAEAPVESATKPSATPQPVKPVPPVARVEPGKHAKFLRENPSAKMLIQGNADERGSREYNVGLGQRRSDTVKKMLTLLGAREEQIESVSLGEEKPMCGEHTEGCWAKNRRGDMLYSGEY